MVEWFKTLVLKAKILKKISWVQIPLLPFLFIYDWVTLKNF